MTMTEGIFKFYQNGELIAESRNNITETGRVLAIKTLLGALPSFGNSIVIGVDSTANTLSGGLATNTELGFEVASTQVTSSHLADESAYDGLVFRATLSDPSSYRFIEAGLYANPLTSGSQDYRAKTLVSFEPTDMLETTAGASLPTTGDVTRLYSLSDSSNFRIGDYCLQVKSSGAVVSNQQIFGLEKYLNTDLISLAFYSEGSGSVDVTFYTDASNYSTFRFTGVTGYNVVSLEKGSTPQALLGTIDWANIAYVKFVANTSDVLLDAIKISSPSRVDTNNGLISRTVLPSVVTKLSNTPLEIEYYLRLGFNV